jgi:glycosyltransferase involved in cell wall biosynthesis
MSASSPPGLRVLLTNITLAGRSGTETVTRDLALSLLRAGHRPMVYSPRLGPIAEELRAASIPVADDIGDIRETPDVIHGHHVVQTAAAAVRFPDVPVLFVCHDFNSWHDVPPKLPNVQAFVAISDGFRDRLVIEEGVDPARVHVVLNAVDTERFQAGPPLPPKPRRALAFVKNHGHLAAIQLACAARGVSVDAVGAAIDRLVDAPEALLHDYDLVFTSARSALEAMACLRPVIVCDGRGLAGLATTDLYPGWRRENFGLRVLSRPVTVVRLLAEIDRYDPDDAVAVGHRVREDAGLDSWAEAYVALYRQMIEGFAPATGDEASRATARHLQTWDPNQRNAHWLKERADLLDTIRQLSSALRALALGQLVTPAEAWSLGSTGFHQPEPWGAWSARRRCSVRFRLEPGVTPTQITVALLPFFTPSRPRYEVAVGVNGRALGRVDMDPAAWRDGEPVRQAFDLPDDLDLDDESGAWLTFETERCVSPQAEGLSADPRELGFALVSLTLL